MFLCVQSYDRHEAHKALAVFLAKRAVPWYRAVSQQLTDSLLQQHTCLLFHVGSITLISTD